MVLESSWEKKPIKEAVEVDENVKSIPTNFNLGIGPTYVSYSQTDGVTMSGVTMTFKADFKYRFGKSPFDIGINTFINVLGVSSSLPDSSARFFGANLRFGYIWPFWLKRPWRLSLMGGLYYTTMLGTSGRFGYNNLIWPQFFPVLSRQLSQGMSAYMYIKYAPLSRTFTIFTLDDRELAIGGGFVMPTKKLWSGWSFRTNTVFMLDIANLKLTDATVGVESTTISLSVGQAF